MPAQPVPLSVGQYGNDSTLDLASVASWDLEGAAWLDHAKRPCGGWSVGDAGIPTIAGMGGVYLGNALLDRHLGTFLLDPPGNAGATFRIAIYVQRLDARWRYVAEVNGARYDIAIPSAAGSQWWTSPPIPSPSGNEGTVEVKVIATLNNVVATEGHVVKAICILADTDDSAPDWPTFSTRHVTADSPDDAHYLKTASDQLGHIVGRYPRVLASHSFGDATSSGAGVVPSYNSTHHYLVQAGPASTAFRVWVYAKRASTGTAATSVTVTYDGASVLTSTISNTAFQWLNLGTFSVTEAGRKPLIIEGIGTELGQTARPVTIKRICVIEERADAADIVVTHSGRNDPIPQSFIRPDLSQMRPGAPILATSFQSSEPQKFTDRTTAVLNRKFEALHRTANLVIDHLFDANEALPATSASYAAELTTWKHRVTRGATALRVSALVQRTGYATDADLKFRAVCGPSIGDDSIPYTRFALLRPTWVQLRDVPLDNTDDVIDCSLQAGFVDRNGNPVSGGADSVRLLGLQFRELGSVSGRAYFYEVTTPGAVVPSDLTTVEIPLTVPNDFTARHVRVKLDISASGTTYALGLEAPDGTQCGLKLLPGAALTNGWLSDDEIGDAAPVALLSTLAGVSAQGEWKLLVLNNSGSPVTVNTFGLELR